MILDKESSDRNYNEEGGYGEQEHVADNEQSAESVDAELSGVYDKMFSINAACLKKESADNSVNGTDIPDRINNSNRHNTPRRTYSPYSNTHMCGNIDSFQRNYSYKPSDRSICTHFEGNGGMISNQSTDNTHYDNTHLNRNGNIDKKHVRSTKQYSDYSRQHGKQFLDNRQNASNVTLYKCEDNDVNSYACQGEHIHTHVSDYIEGHVNTRQYGCTQIRDDSPDYSRNFDRAHIGTHPHVQNEVAYLPYMHGPMHHNIYPPRKKTLLDYLVEAAGVESEKLRRATFESRSFSVDFSKLKKQENEKRTTKSNEQANKREYRRRNQRNNVFVSDTKSVELTETIESFADFSDLMFKSEIKNGVRVFHCSEEDCNVTLPSLSRIKRHFLVHTNVKPFKCLNTKCDKKFSRKDNMLQHYRTHCKNKKKK